MRNSTTKTQILLIAGATVAMAIFIPFEIEVPIVVAEKEGKKISVSYWDNAVPYVRLEIEVDHARRILNIRAYKSYAIYWWFRPHLQKQIAIPESGLGYNLNVPNPDTSRFS